MLKFMNHYIHYYQNFLALSTFVRCELSYHGQWQLSYDAKFGSKLFRFPFMTFDSHFNKNIKDVIILTNSNFQLKDWKKELIVSAAIWACAVGAIISGTLNKFFGRKVRF